MAKVEVCVETLTGAEAALAGGAERVELCSCLAVGGVTPSYGTISLARAAVEGRELVVLIRPRAGDFVYSDTEFEVALEDIKAASLCGADGISFGCLSAENAVDTKKLQVVVDLCKSLELDLTFNRAFDMLKDLQAGLETLVALDVPAVLTSGGKATALEASEVVGALVRHSRGRINIILAGGVRSHNVADLVRKTGVSEVHSSASRPVERCTEPPAAQLSLSRLPLELFAQDTDAEECHALCKAAADVKLHPVKVETMSAWMCLTFRC